MINFIKPEYAVSLYMVLYEQEIVALKDLGDYVGKLNKELRENNVEAVFLFSSNYIDEMLINYKDCFLYLYNDYFYENDSNTTAIKRKVPNEELLDKFIAYLSNDVLKVACILKAKEEREKTMKTEEMIEVMKAYTEGKTIQCKRVDDHDWYDCNPCTPAWNWRDFEYRIKQESTYRPYKDIEELFEDAKKRDEKLQHPLFSNLWLKHKKCGIIMEVTGFDESEEKILLGTIWTILKVAFDSWTYLDGSPFGIKETVND